MRVRQFLGKKALVRVAIFAISAGCIASIQFFRNRPPSADYTQKVKDIFNSAVDPQAPSPPAFVTDLQVPREAAGDRGSSDDVMPLIAPPSTTAERHEIIADLSHPDVTARGEALMQIIRLGLQVDASSIVPLSNDPDPEVRTAAVLALGIQGAPMGLLLKSFEDSDVRVRFAGYQAMGYYRTLTAVRVLFRQPRDELTRPLLEESINRILFPASWEGVKPESVMVAASIE